MNYFLAVILLLSSANSPAQDTAGVARFKAFARSYFAAVGNADTVFLKDHTTFPIKNSDFGFYISAGKEIPSISSKFYFSHLKTFYKPSEVSAALKNGDFRKHIHSDNQYYLRLERPLKENPDVLETFTWFFEKRGDDFVFRTYKYEAN